LTFEGLSPPSDLWVPSTEQVKPQQSWQTALGLARTFNNKYEVSIEGFYKEMKNVVAYKEGASFLFGLENDWQDKVTQGNGTAYGMELFLQKKKGKTTGWIGYTLSWNNRQFDELNGGREFPFRYDRRHDVSVVVVHELTDNISLSGAWVFGTGNAVTLNVFRYPTEVFAYSNGTGSPILYFNDVESGGQQNAFRMTDYHRLDFSIEFRKKKPNYERTWTVGAYNVYNHNNPYFMIATSDYDPVTETSTRKFKEISILPIIPSVSFGIKF